MKIRNGTATVSEEAFYKVKAGHWKDIREGRKMLQKRESGDLLECYRLGPLG